MRVYLHTFGCKANQTDTERVRQALEDRGAQVVSDPADADVAVVNSCTVTHVGEAKMRRFVRHVSREQPEIDTVVMGCAAAVDDGSIAALPSVRAVVAGGDPAAVLRAVGLSDMDVDPVLRRYARGGRAWLKVQDGCDEHCTFCATTLARGANESRDPAVVVTEAAALADHHAELVITGVHIGSYGHDLEGDWSLSRLVERIVTQVPAVRLRLSSIEATEIDDRLFRLMVESDGQLAPHIHAPLQSGSDRVLKRMGRHWYTAREYAIRLERLAERLPVFGLGADIMVGFPGESALDHEATTTLVERLPYTYLHVFPYSPRPGVAAPRLGAPVQVKVQRERASELRALGEHKGTVHRAARLGRVADGVFVSHRTGAVEFVTEDYLTVRIPVESWDGRIRMPITVN